METQERTFILRFSLAAAIDDSCWQDEAFEEDGWLNEWEAQIKPGLLRAVMVHVRAFEGWQAHIRNRGLSPLDEIEIVLTRTVTP